MYNPDQHYQAHAFHLKDLYESQQRHAMGHAVGTRLGVVLVRLGTWLARSTTSSQPSLRWRAARKLAGWGRAVAMPSGQRPAGSGGDREGASGQICAAEMCMCCIPG
jgi:hypothetical protein